MKYRICRHCLWWRGGIVETGRGTCHFHAPVQRGKVKWPETGPFDFCANWQQDQAGFSDVKTTTAPAPKPKEETDG